MQKLITKKVFMNIFKNEEYRYKLDKIILNFFGLEIEHRVREKEIKNEDVTLKFVFMINTEVVLNISIKDTKRLFSSSKIFYLNLSYRKVEKYHELLIPCYWEIYIPYCYQHLKEMPKIILLSALFYCETEKEVKKIFEKLETFTENEVQDILKIIQKNI